MRRDLRCAQVDIDAYERISASISAAATGTPRLISSQPFSVAAASS